MTLSERRNDGKKDIKSKKATEVRLAQTQIVKIHKRDLARQSFYKWSKGIDNVAS